MEVDCSRSIGKSSSSAPEASKGIEPAMEAETTFSTRILKNGLAFLLLLFVGTVKFPLFFSHAMVFVLLSFHVSFDEVVTFTRLVP